MGIKGGGKDMGEGSGGETLKYIVWKKMFFNKKNKIPITCLM